MGFGKWRPMLVAPIYTRYPERFGMHGPSIAIPARLLRSTEGRGMQLKQPGRKANQVGPQQLLT